MRVPLIACAALALAACGQAAPAPKKAVHVALVANSGGAEFLLPMPMPCGIPEVLAVKPDAHGGYLLWGGDNHVELCYWFADTHAYIATAGGSKYIVDESEFRLERDDR